MEELEGNNSAIRKTIKKIDGSGMIIEETDLLVVGKDLKSVYEYFTKVKNE